MADLIVVGRRVLGARGAEAVAVAGGRVVAVGPRRSVLALRGPRTRVVERERGLLCPGFHDAHVHLGHLALARLETDLHGLGTERVAEAVRSAAAARPAGRWIVGRGFAGDTFRGASARAVLDQAAPAHPVLLRSHDYHAVALNTAALVLSGVLEDLRGFSDGEVGTDASGDLTGLLHESAAVAASVRAGDVTEAELLDAVERSAHELASAGIVAVHDMSGTRHLDVLRRLDEAGRLPLDVFASLSARDAADEALRRPGRRLFVRGVKLFLDGALGSRTARLLSPYEHEAVHAGLEVTSADAAREEVEAAARAGLPSWLHAIGDAAVRTALDVVRGVRGPGGVPLRHRVEHAQMIHDADLPRFAAEGVVASVQPVHLLTDAPLVLRHWGARSRAAFPLRRLLDSGAHVAFGSDAPIETHDVIAGIRAAVERRGRNGTPLHPEEAVTVEEALHAYTAGAARAACADDLAAVREGGPASLTLLDLDVGAEPAALPDARIALTVVHGEVLHEAER